MELKQTKKWAEGKPEFPAAISIFGIAALENVLIFLNELKRNPEMQKMFYIDRISEWSKLYPIHNSIELFKKPLMERVVPETKKNKFIELNKKNEFTETDMAVFTEFIWDIIDILHSTDDLFDDIPENKVKETWREFLNTTPEFIFFLDIYLPCIFNYKVAPYVLLEKTKAGDFQSLINLLELDKNIINLPEIRQIWAEESRNPRRFKMMSEALTKSPANNVSLSKFKIILAAAIEGLFKSVNHNISRTHIAELFNAYSKDTKGKIFDDDLPDSEEAFSRAINREIKKFKEAFASADQSLPI